MINLVGLKLRNPVQLIDSNIIEEWSPPSLCDQSPTLRTHIFKSPARDSLENFKKEELLSYCLIGHVFLNRVSEYGHIIMYPLLSTTLISFQIKFGTNPNDEVEIISQAPFMDNMGQQLTIKFTRHSN